MTAALVALTLFAISIVWGVRAQRDAMDDCSELTTRVPRLGRFGFTTEWSWSQLRYRCVFRNGRTGELVVRTTP